MRGKCIKNLQKKAGEGNKQNSKNAREMHKEPSEKCGERKQTTFGKKRGKETNNPRKNAREQWLVN